jgi:hypothetical protein
MSGWNVFARDQAPPPPAGAGDRRDELERLQLVLANPAARQLLAERLAAEEARRVFMPGLPAGTLEYHEGRKDALRDLISDLDKPLPRS